MRLLDPALAFCLLDKFEKVRIPLDPGIEVQAHRQNLPLGARIDDLGDQRVAKFSGLEADVIATTAPPATELEAFQFA